MGRRHGSDPALLWLWRRLAATAPIRPLAWEPPYAEGVAQEMAKRPKKKKKKGRKEGRKEEREHGKLSTIITLFQPNTTENTVVPPTSTLVKAEWGA